MKKVKSWILIAVMFTFGIAQTGCIGPFQLTNGLYDWNKSATDGKFGNALIFFLAMPVYSVTLTVDGPVLNTIKFWGGETTLSMKEGEEKVKMASQDGNIYKITATRNQYSVRQVEGDQPFKKYDLVFKPEQRSWFLEEDGNDRKLVQLETLENGRDVFHLHGPDGNVETIDAREADDDKILEELNAR